MDVNATAVKRVFLVGAPRSGTTWLQLLLWQHPDVSSCMETHLFKYLAPMVATWNHYKNDRVGLQSIISESEFEEILKMITDRIFANIGNTSVVVEKTTDHVFSADLILRIIPQAWFLHLIRDPRAVASSLISAGASWGSHWASTSTAKNARYWAKAVSAGLDIKMKTTRYLEVRYEDLKVDGITQLERIFCWLGLESDPAFCKRAIETCTLDRLRAKTVEAPWPLDIQPDGFYRRGIADGWREELSQADIRIVEYIAGDMMRRLGYKPVTAQKKPLSMILADVESILAGGCVAVGRRWYRRIESRRGCLPPP